MINNAARQSAIPGWITIHHATINEDNQAEISYSIAEGQESEWMEEEETQWKNILQLTALDFHVEALRLVNETEQVISIFPFKNNN
ncbi:hypothetical protein [Gracilibacillus phocaeensis]|uniref:hypothetical protein n=1 Tax=Gracilibacillus phocaeensis TaxID=2042304 RepID=UPI0010318203|nr:hypothetical protein [Gracilibacillus phocaeensis]